MKSKSKFKLEILNQEWLDNNKEQDLCSHGKIYLGVNSVLISNKKEKWGISESALSLLRSLFRKNFKVTIFHGCGAILMTGCPISIEWKVKRQDGYIFLSNFKKYPTTDEVEVIDYKNLKIRMKFIDYAQIIYEFSKKAKIFFGSIKKKIKEEYDRKQYIKFWREYDNKLKKIERLLKEYEKAKKNTTEN